MEKFDIAIIGLGPAGSTLARLLKPSLKVAAIDKKTTQENSFCKPCGGLLAPDAQKALALFDLTLPKEVLVNPQIFAVRTIDSSQNLIRHYQRFYLNLDRHKFDLWLKSLIPNNVRLFNGATVHKIERKQNGFEVSFKTKDETETLFAKHIVGADGANSIVRRKFFPAVKIHGYTAVQEWFKEEHENPFYSCLFDEHITDCYSWSVSKDGYLILGGAFKSETCHKDFEELKKKVQAAGFRLGNPLKREACLVLSPKNFRQFCTGGENVFLLGEAAGFISPSSLEGISSALQSALALSRVFNTDTKNKNTKYYFAVLPLRLKLWLKLLKCPFIYNPFLRKLVMKSGLSAINVTRKI